MSEHKKVIKIEEKISLQTLAQRMSLKATEVLMKLLGMGMPGVNINSSLDADTAKLLASEFGWDVSDVSVSEEEALGLARGADAQQQDGEHALRPPIVTVMGHVDHGKTSLLDQIRKANVAASEAGGITQHIGAYRVNTSRGPVTFLDTPGHAAFTAMRARGAQVTDIVILVVAADDGVMPQTREAVNHARAAKVPIIVAVNKIDKPGVQPERVRRELAELELVPEEWGGETIYCDVSAKTRQGIDNLLEMVALQAEVMDLQASPSRAAVGNVLEALLDRGRGPVARVLVTDGTLHSGDILLAGPAWGKVRAMTDDRGRMVAEAGPATPVEILGLSEVPNAGDPVHVVKDPKKAQEIAQARKSKATRSLIPASAKVTLEDLAKRMAEADQLELRLVIKADVQGSVEALCEALAQLSSEKVKVAIIHAAVGGITEGDVNLAVASKAIIVGFNVRPAGKAGSLAETESVQIRTYSVIYDAIDDIRKAMLGLLGPTTVEKSLGKAEVRQAFHIAKVGAVAGCFVSEGTLRRNARVRLVRDSVPVWEGRFSTMKHFKEDAKEVEKGFECGLSFEGFSDFKVGDVVECFEIEEVQPTL
jgi:translation initiation factor IF-2